MSNEHDPDGPVHAEDPHLPEVGDPMPPIDFNTFILSMASATLMHLGEVEGPEGRKGELNLPLARHHIDLVAMLQEKTKGNLTGEEERILDEVIDEMRERFEEVSKG